MRTNKGLILKKEHLDDLLGMLEYEIDWHKDTMYDFEDEDPEYFERLKREIHSAEFIIAKIRRDARMPEEKEGKKDE